MSGRATHSQISRERLGRVEHMALHTYVGPAISSTPHGYGIGSRDRARERFGDLAVAASIEQWALGNSESPFRLCEAFMRQYVQEEAEGVELPPVSFPTRWERVLGSGFIVAR